MRRSSLPIGKHEVYSPTGARSVKLKFENPEDARLAILRIDNAALEYVHPDNPMCKSKGVTLQADRSQADIEKGRLLSPGWVAVDSALKFNKIRDAADYQVATNKFAGLVLLKHKPSGRICTVLRWNPSSHKFEKAQFSPDNVNGFHMKACVLVPGRLLQLTCSSRAGAVVFFAVHVYAAGFDAVHDELGVLGCLAAAFRQVRHLPCYLLGGWNFLERGEGHLKEATAACSNAKGPGRVLQAFEQWLPGLVELHQPEQTWARAGTGGRLDRIYCSISPVLLAGTKVHSLVRWTTASTKPGMSDHVPVMARFGARTSGRRGPPAWTFKHQAYPWTPCL